MWTLSICGVNHVSVKLGRRKSRPSTFSSLFCGTYEKDVPTGPKNVTREPCLRVASALQGFSDLRLSVDFVS